MFIPRKQYKHLEFSILSDFYKVSFSGNYAIVGNHDEALFTWAAYIYLRIEDTWHLQSTLRRSEPHDYDRYACWVDITADGSCAIISIGSIVVGGRVASDTYIYLRVGADYTLQTKLQGSSRSTGNYLVREVALTSTGQYVVAICSLAAHDRYLTRMHLFEKHDDALSEYCAIMGNYDGDADHTSCKRP